MSGLDYALMALYMLFLVGMGLYYRRFAQKSMENYFLGGRKMKGWMSGTSYAVTCMNADVAPAYCGMTVITGTFICWWYLSRFGLALMIGGLLFARVLAAVENFYLAGILRAPLWRCGRADDARLGLDAQRLHRSGSLDRSRAFGADESVRGALGLVAL